MAKHATMALAVLLGEPAGAHALLGLGPCREAPPGLREAMAVRLCDASAREPVLLAALEVQPHARQYRRNVAFALITAPVEWPFFSPRLPASCY